MKKKNQPFDSVNTSGLVFETKQEQVPVTATPEVDVAVVEVEVKKEPVVVEKVEAKKAPKKKRQRTKMWFRCQRSKRCLT